MGKTSSRKDGSKHADRKFEKKLDFYAKVRDTIALNALNKAALGVQKSIKKTTKLRSRQKKLKAYNLSSLAEFLPELAPPKEPTPVEFKVTSKTRQKLVMKEANVMKTVLNDDAFKADPLATLHQHLQSTQPVSDEKPARKSQKGKNGRKKNKKKSKTGSQSMEE